MQSRMCPDFLKIFIRTGKSHVQEPQKRTENSADFLHRLEHHIGEGDRHSDGFHIGQL